MTCTLNQRADGYVASDLFFFGINTAVRLGVAAAPGLNLTNPLTGVALTEAGAASAGTLLPGQGPPYIPSLMFTFSRDLVLSLLYSLSPTPLSLVLEATLYYLRFYGYHVRRLQQPVHMPHRNAQCTPQYTLHAIKGTVLGATSEASWWTKQSSAFTWCGQTPLATVSATASSTRPSGQAVSSILLAAAATVAVAWGSALAT